MRRAGLSEVVQRHPIQLGRVKLASGAKRAAGAPSFFLTRLEP